MESSSQIVEEFKLYSVSDEYIGYLRYSKGQKELKGTLRISHMIPVPSSELQLYDIENEQDSTYKDLVQNEIIFIRKNQEKEIKIVGFYYYLKFFEKYSINRAKYMI